MSSSATNRFPITSLGELKVQSELETPKPDSEPADVSDEALMNRLKDEDEEAFGLLFRRYRKIVLSVGRRILRDDSEAEDFAQDLFLFIQRKCTVFDRSKSSVGSWIVQMAYHRAIERRRYLTARHFYTREEVESDASLVSGGLTVEDDYSAEAVFGRSGLQKVLDSLSDDQRDTLRLFFFEGYTLAEISTKVGQPLANIRHHYYRGLDKVRKQMFRRKAQGS
jgi:RNA polymerase sigma-70 factor (ECF subfamily)